MINGTIRALAMNGKKYQYAARMGNYVRYVSGYSVVDRYGQLSKHYYAGSERIASRLAGPSTAFVDAEDLEGDHVDALPALQQMDIRIPVQGWGIGLGQGSFENVPLPGDVCGEYEAGSEEHKQCICEQEGTCPDVIYWYHPDHLGSSTFLTDRAGQPYQFVMYLPFGETFAEQRAAGFGTPYLFNAKELDEETGLYYYGARYYDPRVSMWWGVDPLAGEMPAYSPYTYTFNNPIRFIDPDGRAPTEGDDWYENSETGELEWRNSQQKTLTDDRGEWNNIGEELLTFDGSNLTFHTQSKSQEGNLTLHSETFSAVSGRQKSDGTFDYSKEAQASPFSGPLPEGDYSVNPSAIQWWSDQSFITKTAALVRKGSWPGGTVSWGQARVWLNPQNVDVTNPATGGSVQRSNFSIHGGAFPGSAGCIDCTTNDRPFFNKLSQSQSSSIRLRVKY